MSSTVFVGDIVERGSDSPKQPDLDFSDRPISDTGFPKHKVRWKTSAFKQRRAGQAGDGASASTSKSQNGNGAASELPAAPMANGVATERERIDRENRQRIENMTQEEIAQAQDDLMRGLNPALVQRLLQRATIDEAPDPKLFPESQPAESPPAPPKVTVEDADEPKEAPAPRPKSTKNVADGYNEDAEPPQLPPDLFPITDPPPKTTHFPAPPRVPDIDPTDPNFLAKLHEKYFPDLPADPSKLAWMAPVPTEDSIADRDSSYYPHPEISVSALRFDFRGRFLSPRVSRSISSDKGLHHHGEAPEAAGYTVAELSRLARSAVPAQRCIAYQTLGRILYRLGRGEWGSTPDHPIAMGVWTQAKAGRVLDTLMEEATAEGGHRSSKAFATEALWLFEKGGWKEKVKGR